MNVASRLPELSVILGTDTFETIRPVLEKLRQQTVANRIEVILVAPSAEAMDGVGEYQAHFAALRILEVESITPLAIPRAAGIRTAAAPLIFVGETHSFLAPDAAEKLMARAAAGSWHAVTPGFENANPRGVLSWSGFLGYYGPWSACLPAGEIPAAPSYDALYRREVLFEMGGRLEEMLALGEEMVHAMRRAGRRVYFEPAARIGHLNIETFQAWFHEHLVIGLTVGSLRARLWPWWRRIVYIAGAWLIPPVLLWRVWPVIRQTARTQELPTGTVPAILLLYAIKATGELIGYAGGGPSRSQQAAMNHYEVRRVDYVRSIAESKA